MSVALLAQSLAVAAAGQAPSVVPSPGAWAIVDATPSDADARRVKAADDSRALFIRFSQCLLSRKRGAAEAVTAMPPGPAADAAAARLVDEECLRGGAIAFPVALIRGGLWVARYRRDTANAAPPLPAAAPDLAAGVPADERHDRTVILRRTADCLLRADAPDARAALTAAVGSPPERAAYAGLQAHLQPCSPQRPVRFSKAMLAGTLAEVSVREATPAAH